MTRPAAIPLRENILRLCRFCLCWLCILLFAGLAVLNLLRTAYFELSPGGEATRNELVFYRADSPLAALLVLGCAVAAAAWLAPLLRRLPPRLLEAGVPLLLFALSALWACSARVLPRYDQLYVQQAALRWIAGDFQDFLPREYLFMKAHQISFTLFLEGFYRLFGPNATPLFGILNAAAIGWTFWVLGRLCRLLPAATRQGSWFYLFSAGCWCALLFSPYLYGNSLSAALAVTALWQQILWQQGGKTRHILASGLCIALAIQLKSFSLIILAAQCILLLLHALRTKRRQALGWMLALLLLWQGAGLAVHKAMELRIGYPPNEGEPMVGYLAMGLMEPWEGFYAPGWYNEFNSNVYRDHDLDRQAASKATLEVIRGRLDTFCHDPRYAAWFFYKKTCSQWADPTYQGFWISYGYFEGREDVDPPYPLWLEDVFSGRGHQLLVQLMDWYQSIVWACGAAFLFARRRALSLEQLLPGLCVLGGFLFQLFWEGKGQYVLPYFLLALPYAAAGFAMLTAAARRLLPAGVALLRRQKNAPGA